MVVSMVQKHVSALNYKEAIMLVKKHRLDFNIMIDHDAKLFMSNIIRFIDQIENKTLLNFFLNEITENDSTKNVYKNYYKENKEENKTYNWKNNSKVDTIMEIFRDQFIIRNKNEYKNLILMTYIKETKDGIIKALKYILDTFKIEKSTELLSCLEFIQRHIQDDDLFYNTTLSMYNISLVLMVAQVVNKDPKEYMSLITYLRKFEKTESFYMYFIIDCYLQNYEKALLNIINCKLIFKVLILF